MEAVRQMKIETLKTRIGNSTYQVDADAVAEAIVQRLLAMRHEVRRAAHENGGPMTGHRAYGTS